MQNGSKMLWNTCRADRIAAQLVSKLDRFTCQNSIIEADRKLNSGCIPDRLLHAHHIGNMLSDRLGLSRGIAGIQDNTLDAIGKQRKQLSKRFARHKLRLTLSIFQHQARYLCILSREFATVQR